jgi:N-acetylmuramoyl-L-alanine amidase
VEVLVARGGLKKKTTTTVDHALYKVQLGAFSNRKNAEALAAELKAKGYQVYITKA